jgi:hypothetical protein
MTDPVADLIARERHARGLMAGVAQQAAIRRQALHDLKKILGTWKKVAEVTGQTEPAVYKAALQPGKKKP